MPRRSERLQTPLHVLIEEARRQRDRAAATATEDTPRARFTEANHLMQLEFVVNWLERAPLAEWLDEYWEDIDTPRGGA